MIQENKQLFLRRDDYEIISSYLKGYSASKRFNKHDAEELRTELKRATIVPKNGFPANVVRLNSEVELRDEHEGKIQQLIIVTPEKADIRQRRISFMAPIGIALLGFREGEKVRWQVPSGEKTFMIMKVRNPFDQER